MSQLLGLEQPDVDLPHHPMAIAEPILKLAYEWYFECCGQSIEWLFSSYTF